jgi:transposase
VDRIVELRPVNCHQCGSLLLGDDPEPARRQLSELPPVKAEVTEYRQHTLHCLHCGAQTRAEWPEELPSGSFGPRAQAIVAYLTGRLGLSHRDVMEAIDALHGLKLGLGSVSAIQRRVSNALDRPVKTARQYIHQQPVNHVDETGWPEGENQKWLWINAAAEVPVFTLLKGRGQAEAREVIGRGFLGIVNTDRYAAYHWIDARRRQLCWAHLKREFLAISERGGASSAEINSSIAIMKNSSVLWLVLLLLNCLSYDPEQTMTVCLIPIFGNNPRK